MNLKQIREQIKNITDYSPDLQAYSNQIDSLINNSYLNLWRSKRWSFAQKNIFLDAYPDIDSARELGPDSVSAPITAAWNDGQRLVTFSADVFTLLEHKEVYEGNPIELEGREYTILQVLSTTTLTVTEPIRNTNGVFAVTASSNWRAKARFYTLPEDMVEILSLAHRDIPVGNAGAGRILPPYGKLYGILPRHDEELGLREDYASSYAEAYIPVAPTVVPPAEKLTITYPGFEFNPGLTNLPDDEYYEICWCFMDPSGQLGPLSESVITQFDTPTSNPTNKRLQINFLTFDDKPVKSANTTYASGPGTKRPFEGLKKVIWYNANFNHVTGERLGLPLWRQIITGLPVTSPVVLNTTSQDDPIVVADTVSEVLIFSIDSFRQGTRIYQEYDGQHFRIRPYPRIDAFDFEYFRAAPSGVTPLRIRDFFRRLELRYYYKPAPLALATDTPRLPYEFHSLVVYGTLEDLYNKNGNLQLARVYREKIDMKMKQLEKRYIDRTDLALQKGQFGISRRRYIFDQQSLRNKSL